MADIGWARVAPPEYYEYSHANNRAEHAAWASRMQSRFWRT